MGKCLSRPVEETDETLKTFYLGDCTYASTPEYDPYNLTGQSHRCMVVKVYDGDTVWLALPIHGTVQRVRVRCARYNSAEIRSGKKDPIEKAKEKALGLAARDFVYDLIGEKVVQVDFTGLDKKWKRPLVEIHVPDSDKLLADVIMKAGHGVPYMGVGDKGY